MSWTPELIKELKKLWKKGLTTGEIGRVIGMSKNAVVGKAHRLGLESRPSPIKREEAPKKEKASRVIKKVTKPAPKKEQPVAVETAEPVKAVKKTKSGKNKGVKLVDLKPTSCRWPEGDPKDPDFHFCGKEAVPGKSYCEEHCAVAYSGVFKAR